MFEFQDRFEKFCSVNPKFVVGFFTRRGDGSLIIGVSLSKQVDGKLDFELRSIDYKGFADKHSEELELFIEKLEEELLQSYQYRLDHEGYGDEEASREERIESFREEDATDESYNFCLLMDAKEELKAISEISYYRDHKVVMMEAKKLIKSMQSKLEIARRKMT
jgi:hypothetical protein